MGGAGVGGRERPRGEGEEELNTTKWKGVTHNINSSIRQQTNTRRIIYVRTRRTRQGRKNEEEPRRADR